MQTVVQRYLVGWLAIVISAAGAGPARACIDDYLGGTLPLTHLGSTVGGYMEYASSCGGAAAPERAYSFTAPAAGTYRIDTAGSSFDTVLSIWRPNCGGVELACNDDSGSPTSELIVGLDGGETVAFVVDGYGEKQGNFVLHVALTDAVTPTPGAATATPLPSPTVPPPTPIWQQAVQSQGVGYFLVGSARHIERYDLAAETWLDPLLLSDTALAFWVDTDGVYVSYGRSIVRFNLDGSGERHLKNTVSMAHDLITVGTHLFIFTEGEITSVDKNSGITIDQQETFYDLFGVSAAPPTVGRLFGRSGNVSPSDIVALSITAAGQIGREQDSQYHGDYPDASRTWVMPNGARVIDNAGIAYTTNDLSYAGSLAGYVDDLDFYGDLPIVLRGNTLLALNGAFQETGRYVLAAPPATIFVFGEAVFAFFSGASTPAAVVKVPVGAFGELQPGQPIDPTGVPYTPDSVALGTDGIVYILSTTNLSIFRWSVTSQAYSDTIPLAEAPQFMAYAPLSNRLYLAYPSGRLSQIRLDEGIREQPFATTPQRPHGLAAAGEFIFASDPSGAWATHYTYGGDGTLITQKEWNYYSEEYVWNAANRRMYFFRDDTSPNDLLYEDIATTGQITGEGETPYHSSEGFEHPIRVAPDGSIVVLGSGYIFDAHSLVRIDSLSNEIADAAWVGKTLFTLRSVPPDVQVQQWNGTYAVTGSRAIAGDPVRLLPLANALLVITRVEAVPQFTIINDWDRDGDGVVDAADNCPDNPNPNQGDSDHDGIGDACQTTCEGDCDGNGAVTVDELMRAVTISLGTQLSSVCPAADLDRNSTVTVDEILAAVNRALNGCTHG